MKKSLLSLFIVAMLTLMGITPDAHAQDGFFSNAQTLEKGTFAIGIQPVILTAQDDEMLIGRISYGISHGLTTHLKAGFLGDEDYIGAHFESNLATEPASEISVALLAGAYSYGDAGLKLGLNISKDFHPVSLYTGLNYNAHFADPETINAFLIPVGLDLHLKPGTLDLMVEGDIPVNDEAEFLEAITFGARIYLN